jgi:hypothetical protein
MPSPSRSFGSRAIALTLSLLAVFVLSAVAIVDPARAEALIAENAIIEWLQVAMMSGAAVLAARHGFAAAAAGTSAALDVAMVAGLTMAVIGEIDLDRLLFGTKLIATQFFVNAKYPLGFRALAVLVIVGVPVAVGLWLLPRWRAVLGGVLSALRQPWGQIAACGVLVYVVTQIFERPIDNIPGPPRNFLEEVLEFVAAICIFVGVAARRF